MSSEATPNFRNIPKGNKTTRSTTKADAVAQRKWRVVDAAGKPVGRVATRVAHILLGKDKATYTPHADDGDFVIITNASQAVLTGNKLNNKLYQHHTGYIGGLVTETARELMEKRPEEVLERAVKRMLPKGALFHNTIKKLKVYSGSEHPHAAQKPETVEL